MSHLEPTNQPQITCHAFMMHNMHNYKVDFPNVRDRIPFVKKSQQIICNFHQLKSLFSLEQTNLFCRRVVLLTKAQIDGLPSEMVHKGWKTFFDAMYLLIQRKKSPKEIMSADEWKEKNVNIPEAIRLLTSLIERPVDEIDPDLRPITLMLLAYFHHYGWGIEYNLEKAAALYTQALDLGINEAKTELGFIEKNNSELKFSLLDEATKAGSIRAMIELGHLYAHKDFPHYNLKMALDLLTKANTKIPTATHMNQGEGAYSLAVFYAKQSNPKDYKKIQQLLEHAVSFNHPEACILFGEASLTGHFGIKKNNQKALKILTKAYLERYGNAARALISIYNLKKDYINCIKYSLKALRYGTEDPQRISQAINKIINDNRNLSDTQVIDSYKNAIIAFSKKNSVKDIFESVSIKRSSLTSKDTEQENERQYKELFNNLANPVYKQLLQEIDNARTPENLRFIKQVAIPLFNEYNIAYMNLKQHFHHVTNQSEPDPIKFYILLKEGKTEFEYIANQENIEQLLTAYASCTPLDLFYLLVLLDQNYFYSTMIHTFLQNLSSNAMSKIYNQLVLGSLKLAAVPLNDLEKVFLPAEVKKYHSKILDQAYYNIKHLTAMKKSTLTFNLTEMPSISTSKPYILNDIIYSSITFQCLHRKKKFIADPKLAEDLELLQFIIVLLGNAIESEKNLYNSTLKDYSIEDQRTIMSALKELGFNAKDVLTILPKPKTQAEKTELTKHLQNIENAINTLHSDVFVIDIEAEKARKAAEAEQKALEAQKQREEIQRKVWQTTQKNAENACTSCREKINTTQMSPLRNDILSRILGRMLQMNQLIQDTTEYTQTHNTNFQKLKKQFDSIISLPQTQIAEDYESLAGSAIAEVETYMSDSLNAKKEIMEREAQRKAEEAEKQAKIEAAQAERAASRADKQKEYQEEQEALKAQEALKSKSSSDEETLATGAIESFKGKEAKLILESQKDDYAGNAVRILNLIQEAKNFDDIRSNLLPGDSLHDLNSKVMVLKNGEKLSCFALKVNDQYRITFYWSTTENKAYKVWFGDYHV